MPQTKKVSIRSMLIAPPGMAFVSVDLSQAESWVVAYLAKERNMQWSLNNSDIHTDSAAALFAPEIYCQHQWVKGKDEYNNDVWDCLHGCGVQIVKTARYIGKRYNHASAYRMKPPRAAQVINKDSDKPPYVTVTIQQSKLYSQRWHTRYHLGTWWSEIEEQLNINRTMVTPYGRSITFFDQWGDELFRKATACVPQSTVADHFNGKVQRELGVEGGLKYIYHRLVKPYSDRKIVNQSHDSCIVECPSRDAEDLNIEMQHALKRPLVVKGVEFTIPVDGEIGERWGELKAA